MTGKSRKGSVTVFLVIFFISIAGCLQIFLYQSEKLAVKGSAESLGTVFAQSLLAEYDVNLKERYGIFGLPGPESELNRKCAFYGKEAFRGKKKIHFENASCIVSPYSLCNTELFRKQVIEESSSAVFENIKEKAGEDEEDSGESYDGREDPFIENMAVIYYLPSRGTESHPAKNSLGKTILEKGSLKDAVSQAGEKGLVLAYIQHYFRNCSGKRNPGKTFFRNEQEYLVCGKFRDSKNRKTVRNRIVSIREVVNYACLRKDEAKSAMVLSAAELLTPGPAAAATAEGLFSSWALAESINDYKLLLKGHRIPAVKTPDLWAVDLQSVINNEEQECIFTGTERGEDYSDYMNLFLSVMDEHLLLLRMMDLIQINMKYLYYDDFILKDCYGGLKVRFTVNGEEYETEKEY